MDEIEVQCPYCFQTVTMHIEADLEGSLVQDCEVCCRPWQLVITRDDAGQPDVLVERS